MSKYNEIIDRYKNQLDLSEGTVGNVNGSILFIQNYSPTNNHRPISIAFQNDDQGMLYPKVWVTESELKMVNGNGPYHCPGYEEIEHNRKVYYPYSIQTAGRSLINDLLHSLRTLYNHVIEPHGKLN